MGKKSSGGRGAGRGRSAGNSYSPALNSTRSARQMGRLVRDHRNAEKQLVTDAMQHALRHGQSARPATKKGPSVKPLGKADAGAVKKAKSAKRPSKAQRELQNAAAVRKTLGRLHRKSSRA